MSKLKEERILRSDPLRGVDHLGGPNQIEEANQLWAVQLRAYQLREDQLKGHQLRTDQEKIAQVRTELKTDQIRRISSTVQIIRAVKKISLEMCIISDSKATNLEQIKRRSHKLEQS
ncbi:hypothetical protein F511_23974 [Dorcoceras hygrometricum]|uniref:Uncharacterized protein n=1 Tax=Dorcoceras hygrometricum TaxID=472368 RepID=A0A2Z7AHU3_9LAMI|nr:hypothetical protein F511_23974 [Dorcoceras hygrometricum]